MNVKKISIENIFFSIAFVFLIANISNMFLWVLGFSVSPFFYLLCFSSFLFFYLRSMKSDVGILLIIFFLGLWTIGQPLQDWDARSIWFFHAKRIFFDNNIYAQLDNYAGWSHNDYPVLLPAIAASFAKSIGFWNEYFPKLSMLCLIFPIFLIFKRTIRNVFLFNIWLIGTIFICRHRLVNGYMDAPLALYSSAGLLFLVNIYSSLKFDKQSYILFFLVLVTLPFIKNEGVLALILFSICLIPKIISNFKFFGYFLLTILPYLIFWKLPLLFSDLSSGLFPSGIFDRLMSRLSNPSEMMAIFDALIKKTGIFYLFFLIFLYRHTYQDNKNYVAIFFVCAYTSCILLVYLITPYNLIWHLNTSTGRSFLVTKMCIFSFIIFVLSNDKLKKLVNLSF